jgi:hypothetical protein
MLVAKLWPLGESLMKTFNLAYQPTKTDYFLVLLLIFLSGSEVFTTGRQSEPLLIIILICIIPRMVLLWRDLEIWTFLAISLSLTLIVLSQTFFLDYVLISTPFGFLVKLMVGAGIIGTVKFFRLAFVRTMVWVAILSLIFHLPSIILATIGIKLYEILTPISELVGVESSGVNMRVNIFFHNFMGDGHKFRNSGIFWEPGAFSGYLIVTLILLTTIRFDLPVPIFKLWQRILVVTLLTTLSTTGYLFLPFALFLSRLAVIEAKGDDVSRFIWVTLFVLLLVPVSSLFWQLEFLGPKIQELYARAEGNDAGWQLSRFGAVIFDLKHIQVRPFFGWSPANPELYSLFPWLERYETGNGFSGYIRKMGIAGMLIFIFSLWIGLGRVGLLKWSKTLTFSLTAQWTEFYELSIISGASLYWTGAQAQRLSLSQVRGMLE